MTHYIQTDLDYETARADRLEINNAGLCVALRSILETADEELSVKIQQAIMEFEE